MKTTVFVALGSLALFLLVSESGLAAPETIDFNRDIRPILSENCYHCHGPDENTRDADFRLDVEADAKKDLGGYVAIKPGDPENSELWWRVDTDDPDEIMPPPKSKRVLTASQKDLLKRWIESGGEYDEHWAYRKPSRPETPESAGRRGGAIDHFVLQRLKKEGLSLSSAADRRTLLRRVSLDLTGLPPTPDEIEAFLADSSEAAFETVVDRLLASDRFGEHWARPWLDLARYADSNGFQADQLRDSWAYRDWVINALNSNMPFDQFTIEQLAGDLLPNATLEQKIATGFHRTVTCNVEAGVHPEENRTNQVVDRVNTTGTVWLGATLECAQCHDHKYDPFTMKDYYQVFAYFNQTPVEVRNPSGKGVSFDFYGPKMELPLEPEQQKEREKLLEEQASAKRVLARMKKEALKDRESQLAALRKGQKEEPSWQVAEIVSVESNSGESFENREDGSVLVLGEVPDKSIYTVTLESPGGKIGAIRVEALRNDQLPGGGPGRGDPVRRNFILSEIDLEVRGKPAKLASATADFSQTKWEVAKAIDGDRKTGWAISPQFDRGHWAAFGLVKPVNSKVGDTLVVRLDQQFGTGRTIGNFRISVAEREPVSGQLPDDIAELLTKAKLSAKEKTSLDDFLAARDPEVRRLETELKEIQVALKEIEPPSTLVMVEREEPRETHIMERGEYLSPQEKVEPGTPATLPPIDPDLPKNRLGFAQWLVDEENPLVARVTVNRWWSRIFGHGIVKTLEDFGTQSEPPTHPEMLDWLAVEFMDSGWDMKHVLKEIVMSETYQQESRLTPELAEADPDNRLYGRGPRFRLSAETIRDNALTVSGLLSTKMHGPPVMPYQPPGIWRQVGRNEPKWVEEADEDRWRRGVYIVWRRAAPYPSFVNFDGTDRSACVVDRARTNTPLQALTLLNDPAYVEMALALADRVLRENPTAETEARIDRAFEMVLGRPAKASERATLAALVDRRMSLYEKNADEAQELIDGAKGYFRPTESIAVSELAAWFFVANTLLNLDETVTKG